MLKITNIKRNYTYPIKIWVIL